MKNILTKNFSGFNFLRAALIVLSFCLVSATVTFAQNNTPQRQNGKIAYSYSTTYANIYTINPDGTGDTDISSFPNPVLGGAADYYPYFSWDGSKIYFTSIRDEGEVGYGETYVVNAGGGNPTRLSNNAYNGGNGSQYPYDNVPAVSPDGATVIFQGSCPGNPACLRTTSASGYTSTHTTNGSTILLSSYFAFTPSYSPDGTKIVFDGRLIGCGSCYGDILAANANGTNITRLAIGTSFSDKFINARFSPDGTKIIYEHVNNSARDVFVINADGTNQTALTNTGDSSEPSWSPDGAKIVFVKNTGTYNLYTMDANGANKTLFIARSDEIHKPSWGASPYVTVSPANAADLTVAFSNVNSGGSTTATAISPEQTAPAPQGYAFPSNAPAYDISTTATFSGTIDVTLQVQGVANATDCSKLRILHYTNGAWTDAGNAAPQYDSGTSVCTLKQTVSSLSPFAVAQIAAGPTAANVSVSGRVITGKRGIRNAIVTLTEQDGTSHAVLTGVSGSYRFDEIPAGQTVILSVRAKRFTFNQPTQILTPNEDFAGINFYANESFQLNINW